MKTVVMIGGIPVEVPYRELKPLINKLTVTYNQLIMSGHISAEPIDSYLSHGECMEVLSEIYSGAQLRRRTGNLWGAICRLSQKKLVNFDIFCTDCNKSAKTIDRTLPRSCLHGVCKPYGTGHIVVLRSDIIAYHSNVVEGSHHGVGEAIRSDYDFLFQKLFFK